MKRGRSVGPKTRGDSYDHLYGHSDKVLQVIDVTG